MALLALVSRASWNQVGKDGTAKPMDGRLEVGLRKLISHSFNAKSADAESLDSVPVFSPRTMDFL